LACAGHHIISECVDVWKFLFVENGCRNVLIFFLRKLIGKGFHVENVCRASGKVASELWKENYEPEHAAKLYAFSETPQKIPPPTDSKKTRPAYRSLVFPPIHSAHHNNKLYYFLFSKRLL
jgi:hypothetical protein